jgi:hypothetical protein
MCLNIARNLVFSQQQNQGIGIWHPFVTQGLRKTIMFLDHTFQETCQLKQASWETTMIECGPGENFLADPYSALSSVMNRMWITTLWEFLDSYEILLAYSQWFFLLSKVQWLECSVILRLNFCRLYLQIELLSDVIMPDGRKIRN